MPRGEQIRRSKASQGNARDVHPDARVRTPKQTGESGWYSYYAGFSQTFAHDALNVLEKHAGEGLVIDPWNGSGTTTTVAVSRNRGPVAGFDLNPALVVISQARNVPVSFRSSLEPLARELLVAAGRADADDDFDVKGSQPAPVSQYTPDMLANWFKPAAANRLRHLRYAIESVLVEPPSLIDEGPLSELAAFYYTAAFHCVRDLLKRFRSTNPTWVKQPQTLQHRLGPSWPTISEMFLDAVHTLSERLTIEAWTSGLPDIRVGNSKKLPLSNGQATSCLTSPPYCTRIDYTVSARAELAFLGLSDPEALALRQSSLGTTRMKKEDGTKRRADEWKPISSEASKALTDIKSHPSKASATYYSRYFGNYFAGLEESLRELSRVVSKNGAIGIVVQDSHYKEVHIDLQKIVIETLSGVGRDLVRRDDFPVGRSWAFLNPKSKAYEKKVTIRESFIVMS